MPESDDREVLVAILAAGRATRFGGGKLDAPLAGKPVGAWVLDAVAEADLAPGVIVSGPDRPDFVRGRAGWRAITNPDPSQGLGSSVSLAIGEARKQGRDVLLLLADMPLISPEHLCRLTASSLNAATTWPEGRVGVPALIRRAFLEHLVGLRGDRGAGQHLADLEGLEILSCPPELLIDIDCPEDLVRASQLLERRQGGQ
ncbi:nucleotidyltransferase family protein [Aurantiacibacter poecillastricola]|uniref:nucleotidyltransferase family protein n=1 Tax=Aurantiacibacter poecillastricola TaxID=3064385 RepID=UPI00273E100A|nr:nucleotidyltransferase family protein [Aurantiacibacter sp. 219JJ12-13]MDP5261400.1 nucleotidyltransferase family protein [Aurantiacibacter sp. 219JJ12-13]